MAGVAAPSPPTYSSSQYSSRNTPSLSSLIQNKTSIKKTCATDSVGCVLGRFTNLFNTLAVDYAVFDDFGYIRPEMWNGVVEVMKIFLASIPSAFSHLEGEARKDTQDSDIFNHNHTVQASQQQLKKWVASTWNNVSDLTELRRLA